MERMAAAETEQRSRAGWTVRFGVGSPLASHHFPVPDGTDTPAALTKQRHLQAEREGRHREQGRASGWC